MSHPAVFRALATLIIGSVLCARLAADPLSKNLPVNFFRQVPSRDLHGLATRSDGRLVSGPVLSELRGTAPAELLWCLEPISAERWLVGTGPEGRIFEIMIDAAAGSYTSREIARLNDGQVFALKPLADGGILVGTSPKGELALVRDGKIQARIGLPADSIFDLLLLPAGADARRFALVATGSPARIYRVDLAKFASGGDLPKKIQAPEQLAAHGIALFGMIRDQNVRRLARLSDGRIAAGSSPNGNVYVFPAPSQAGLLRPAPEAIPLVLDENHNAEVTDLLPQADGDFLAAIVTNGGGNFVSATEKPKGIPEVPPRAEIEPFAGRGLLVRFPAHGFPETLLSRIGNAFYHLAREGNQILIAGGEQGDFTGYDLDQQLALNFAASQSARLNDLRPVPGIPGRYLVLRNNSPGLTLVDFRSVGQRQAETSQIDLGIPSKIGAVRIDRLRDLDPPHLQVEIRTSYGSNELEGWSDWIPLETTGDGWRASELRGRYFKLRLRLPAAAGNAEIDRAVLYFLPQNHRPELQEFHFISPNYALVVQPDSPPSVIATLSQLLQAKDEDKRKGNFLSSQVVPSPGSQVAFWTVTDPDGDNLVCTFSIRREGVAGWTDLAVDSRENYVQFDTSHLPDGIYFTRLMVSETAPRPAGERLSVSFETDDLVVDHTPPEILAASAVRRGDFIEVSVHGRDALSLLDNIEVNFNNGDRQTVEQPADGIRDGREETFVLEEPLARVAGATSVEVTLYDGSGNSATRRLELGRR